MGLTEAGNCIACAGTLEDRKAVRLARSCLIACSHCGSWNYFPRRDESAQIALHDQAEYFEHPYFQNRRSRQRRIDGRCRQIFTQLASAGAKEIKGAHVLDVGCGGGELLEAARRIFGVVPTGVDVSQRAIRELKAKKINSIHGIVADVPDDQLFDIVLAIDVIEHVSDIQGFLSQIARALKAGGVAYIETPNHRSAIYAVGALIANASGGRPYEVMERLFPPHHAIYISRKALTNAAARSGLSVIRLFTRHLPMADIGTSWPTRIGLGALQLADRATGRCALTCLLLVKHGNGEEGRTSANTEQMKMVV